MLCRSNGTTGRSRSSRRHGRRAGGLEAHLILHRGFQHHLATKVGPKCHWIHLNSVNYWNILKHNDIFGKTYLSKYTSIMNMRNIQWDMGFFQPKITRQHHLGHMSPRTSKRWGRTNRSGFGISWVGMILRKCYKEVQKCAVYGFIWKF